MMSGVQLQEATKTRYYHFYEDDKGFQAEIIMNVRDAMVFAQIKKLPDSQTEAVASINEFISILEKDYGAKSTINISPEFLKKLPEGTLKSTKGVGRYIASDEIKKAITYVRNKKHVADQLAMFSTGEYKFLTKEDLKLRHAELSEFKIKYASFVSKEKIENGQYSEKAEEEKLSNPFVEHNAIEHNRKIIGCIMHVIHGDRIYDSDFIVHPNYRSKDIHPKDLKEGKNYPHGLLQALCVKVYDHILDKYNHITGLWLIAGGYGGKSVGAYLYDEVFPTKTLQSDTVLQNTVGIFLLFANPGRELLLAGNRDLKNLRVNDTELKYVEVALNILAQSTEPDLAAKQPQAVFKQKEEVVPISVFTNLNKLPTVLPEQEKVVQERLTNKN